MIRWLILSAALSLSLAALQEPPIYPEGMYCTPRGDVVQGVQTPDHPCRCKRMADPEDSCETVRESSECLQWCHKEHCKCPIACESPKAH